MIERVVILLATYNGEQYLEQQLESVRAQSFTDWRLFIRDDGSGDQTLSIIQHYADLDNRICQVKLESASKGSCANFSALFNWARDNTTFDHIMFCDQDDVWQHDKIALTLQKMNEYQNRFPLRPVLIYTAVSMVDQLLIPLDDRIVMMPALKFNYIISRNYAYGCTMMLNRMLIEKVRHIPPNANNHDHWIALVASGFGYSCLINTELVLYRQHVGNVTGDERGSDSVSRIKRFTSKLGIQVAVEQNRIFTLQLFRQAYSDTLSQEYVEILNGFLNSFNRGRFSTIFTMVKYRIFRKGFLQTIMSFYIILFRFRQIAGRVSTKSAMAR